MVLILIALSILTGILTVILTSREDLKTLRRQTLKWSLITFSLSILLLVSFHQEAHFQHTISLSLGNYILLFAVDGVSIFFVILTALLIPICILIS